MTEASAWRQMRCLHNQPPEQPEVSLAAGAVTQGIVVCVHSFGIGVYLPDARDFGHVDVPFLGIAALDSLDDYPAIGSALELSVFGRGGSREQLKLGVTRPPRS